MSDSVMDLVLDWDDLLDDFEDRIDDLWSMLDHLESHTSDDADFIASCEPFVVPDGAPPEPNADQLRRLAALQHDANGAAAAVAARKNLLLAENDALHLASRARRRYATSARLGR